MAVLGLNGNAVGFEICDGVLYENLSKTEEVSGSIDFESSVSASCRMDVTPPVSDSGSGFEDKEETVVVELWDNGSDWACLKIFNNSGLSVECVLDGGKIKGLMKTGGAPLEVFHIGILFP